MNYLHLSHLNPCVIKNSVSILFCLFLFACSNTQEINNNNFVDNRYSHNFISKQTFRTEFTLLNENRAQRAIHSDHQLMMSILNRPITTDQAMKFAFKQERSIDGHQFANYAVKIRGDKSSDITSPRAENVYTQLISQDINAININAPN